VCDLPGLGVMLCYQERREILQEVGNIVIAQYTAERPDPRGQFNINTENDFPKL
jgi:hypothetical protein